MPTVPPVPARRPASWLAALALFALLALHAWLALSATLHESTTVDEMAHLTAGHVMWAKGDYRLQPENGILPQRWEGLPAWWQHRRLPPPDNPGWAQPNVWTLGHVYFHQLGNDLAAMLLAGRAMNVLWSLATGLLVFAWTRRLFGDAGAWLAALLWTFEPVFLANGALATSDMCMTFFMLASVGAYWWHLHDFRWGTAWLSAVVLGLAFVAKYSAVLLPPMLVILAGVRLAEARPIEWRGRQIAGRGRQIAALAASAALHLAVVVAVIWAFFGFRFLPTVTPHLVDDYTRPWAVVRSEIGTPFTQLVGWARAHRLLPDAYLYGFAFVVDLSKERGAFLNGATSTTGWVQYFPYTFLVKTPLAILGALLAAGAVAARRWQQRNWRHAGHDLLRAAPLIVLFVVYWAFSLTSHLNIGQRHLLPIYPVVFIATGALGWAAAHWRGVWRWAAAACVAAQLTASMRIRPHYLAFFNALAGGPSEGYRHLVDSSLDWGQDLPGLAHWLKARGLPNATTPVYLAYFGTGDPAYYGIHAIEMVPLLRRPAVQRWYRLQPGVYCISATLLSQAYSPIQGPWTPELEREYRHLQGIEPALLYYNAHPADRPALERQVPAAKWLDMWQHYEQLTFKRLCTVLLAREPNAQIGYSINIYRVTEQDIREITGWPAAPAKARASEPGPAAPGPKAGA